MAAGNTKSLADEIFLNPELLFGPFESFPEFQDLFPKTYRNHGDVRLLYKSFQKQRRLLQQQVKSKIQEQCEKPPKDLVDDGLMVEERSLALADTVHLLEILSENLEKENQLMKVNLAQSRKEVERVCHSVGSKLSQQDPVDDKYYKTLDVAADVLI